MVVTGFKLRPRRCSRIWMSMSLVDSVATDASWHNTPITTKLISPNEAMTTPMVTTIMFSNVFKLYLSMPKMHPTAKTDTGMRALSIYRNSTRHTIYYCPCCTKKLCNKGLHQIKYWLYLSIISLNLQCRYVDMQVSVFVSINTIFPNFIRSM